MPKYERIGRGQDDDRDITSSKPEIQEPMDVLHATALRRRAPIGFGWFDVMEQAGALPACHDDAFMPLMLSRPSRS